jgi:hypothetical protein
LYRADSSASRLAPPGSGSRPSRRTLSFSFLTFTSSISLSRSALPSSTSDSRTAFLASLPRQPNFAPAAIASQRFGPFSW